MLLSRCKSIIKPNNMRNLFTVVKQNEVAFRNHIKLEPGIHLRLPIFHTIKKVNMDEKYQQNDKMVILTKDNIPVVTSTRLFYKPYDAQKACFKVDDYQDSINAIGILSMRSIVGQFKYDEIIDKKVDINKCMINNIDKSIDKWGLKCTDFIILDFKSQKSRKSRSTNDKRRLSNNI